MNRGNIFGELKRRNVYSVAIPVVVWLGYRRYGSSKLARVLVRLDHVARFIVNANHRPDAILDLLA